ncbi:flagellin N-terminal helical domain-containing protein [Undibacterium terreum]|uniref:Flagellin n=1 Tax=Undibacterium terreum TaxID=1224302 RepID=A0A916XHW1_9BURK|nr:flagellin [Undibacterium terreum]GGC74395.1 lateral flagellin [Undibacterium terreum]
MLSLHTNAAALSAQNSIGSTQSKLSTSMTRLSTGYRINSAMDDAAGLQIATRLQAQTSGMAMAMRNTQNSISMMQTAEGSFDEVTNMLVRMKDLATQAADASSTAADKTAMQSEFDALTNELSNVMGNTTFGGTALLKDTSGTLSTAGGVNFQIGASTSEKMTIDVSGSIATLHASLLAASAEYSSSGTASTATGAELTGAASATIDLLSTAIDDVGTVRSALGAASNRLDHVYNNLSNISTNTKAASGRIMDVDYASETSNMTSQQMLMQAGTAMLKQSNSMSSLVMSLLQ